MTTLERFEKDIRDNILEATIMAADKNKDGVVEAMKKVFIAIDLKERQSILSEQKALLDRLEKKILEKFGKDTPEALIIYSNHEGGITQRPGLDDVLSLIQSEKEKI